MLSYRNAMSATHYGSGTSHLCTLIEAPMGMAESFFLGILVTALHATGCSAFHGHTAKQQQQNKGGTINSNNSTMCALRCLHGIQPWSSLAPLSDSHASSHLRFRLCWDDRGTLSHSGAMDRSEDWVRERFSPLDSSSQT